MTVIEQKTAYPYITEFKKEPFRSFVLKKRREIGTYYLSGYDKVVEFYQDFNKNLLSNEALNIRSIYWFLLLRKYLKEDKNESKDKIFRYIKKCEIHKNDQIGFKITPDSRDGPDIWSTYFALSCLKLLGLLNEYFSMLGHDQVKEEILNFIMAHRKGNGFLHCLEKDCEIDKRSLTTKTLYYILEIFAILGIDVRLKSEQFHSYIRDKKRNTSLIFKLVCLRFLDLNSEVSEKEVQYFHQFQRENGGFSFRQIGEIDTTFWIVYVLENFSWLLDYNPAGVFSFINLKINEILSNQASWNLKNLIDISKLIILISLIWKKFINEIERLIFKQLEKEKYIDLNQIKSTFGLAEAIEEIISYINLSYNFNLKILNNKIEFNNFIRNLSQGKKIVAQEIYNQLSTKSIISLKKIYKAYKSKYHFKPLKLRDDIIPLVNEMTLRNFFKGKILKKRFYLDFFLEKIIVCDTEINFEQLLHEKEKLKDFKNDIYNMTLKLKNITSQIKDEIESYLILDEIDYAKQRLKFIIRNALMDADFLNENIENSFNEELYYLNVQSLLKSDIAQWMKLYSVLQKRLSETDSYLKEKILEKENLRDLSNLLEKLEEKTANIEEEITKKLDDFRNLFRETLEEGYSNEKFNLLVQEFDKISESVGRYDKIVYSVSQQITTKEANILKKHKKVIGKWLSFKEKFDSVFSYYTSGFQFFNSNMRKVDEIRENVKIEILEISEKAKNKIEENHFQEAFNIIKEKSDVLLDEKTKEIKEIHSLVKKEIKSKQKVYLLYGYILEALDTLEENIIELIAERVQSLKNKVVIERNRSQIEDFDNFVSLEIGRFKTELDNYKNQLDQVQNLRINNVIKGFDDILTKFEASNSIFLKKLNKCKKIIEDFEEKSKVTIIQWEKFSSFINNEISILKDKYVNDIISKRIVFLAFEKKSNYVKLNDLKEELKLSCKVLINKIKDMIDISKINAELHEDDKYLLVFTDNYYLNKELRNYIDNQLLKLNRERIGKILALYDSSIRKSTLNINMLELQNRINDLKIFKDIIPNQFYNKVSELHIDQEREEFIKTKNYFESIIDNDKLAIRKINTSLALFNEMISIIDKQYSNLKVEFMQEFTSLAKKIDQIHSHEKIQEDFESKKNKFEDKLNQTQNKIEEKLKKLWSKTEDSNKLIPEIRELFVKKKNNLSNEYKEKVKEVNDQIIMMKHESFREKLMSYVNDYKIYLSQLLGNLERKVEDNIEIKEFKRINLIVQKRAKNIEIEIKEINKNVNNKIREFNRQSKDFSQTSKYIQEDYNKFINEYTEILSEKVKSLERLVLKSYIDMTIRAVTNEFLTIGFLNHELKIKKQHIQDHLLNLISEGDLGGKYDPRFGIYYENPDILDELDETELEVIKSTNFKLNMVLRHITNFARQYGPIIALVTSIVTISYYLFLFSGGNPAVIAIPVIITGLLLIYYFLRKEKDEKIK
ncbi:MAG: hypothetical protein ACFFA6_01245 [Promethearchaeota archaeon]